MDARDDEPLTEQLGAWNEGDAEALHRLMPQVYGELRKVAQKHMNSGGRLNSSSNGLGQ